MKKIKIGDRLVGKGEPTYFIADIGSNFDGDLQRAKKLARLAKEAGADAAKFQSFLASKIVSRHGFENLGSSPSFQSRWQKPVYDVYRGAEFPRGK
jgi:sialic acid synthase SpsE